MQKGRNGIVGPNYSYTKYANEVTFNVSVKVHMEKSIHNKTLKKKKCWSRINIGEEFADYEESIKTRGNSNCFHLVFVDQGLSKPEGLGAIFLL